MENDILQQLIRKWASFQNRRIRIYLTGNSDSDPGLAVEFLEPWLDAGVAWFKHHEQWRKELSDITGQRIDLQLYDPRNINSQAYVKANSSIIFESLPAPANYETYCMEVLDYGEKNE